MGKKRFIYFLIFIFIISSVAGCKALTSQEQDEQKSTLQKTEISKGGTVKTFLIEPSSLDPAHARESEAFQVVKEIFDGLVDYDPNTLEIIPAIAERWEVSEDATVFTFYLKEGILFHNNRECVAQDFVYSWSRAANKDTASEVAYHLAPIVGFEECQSGTKTVLAGLETPDNYTLVVRLKYSFADFIQVIGHPVFSPVPQEEVEKGEDKFSSNPVGTGPFRFIDWKHDSEISLENFKDYYGENANIDTLIFKIFADLDTALLEFKNKSLDITPVPPGQYKALMADTGIKNLINTNPLLAVYYYGFVFSKSPYKEVKELRQALSCLIDREKISEVIMENLSKPATGFVPEGIYGYKKNMMDNVYDPEKAKGLLIKAGYPNGEGLPKLVIGYAKGASHDEIAQIVQDAVKEVGIKVELLSYEWLDLINKAASGDVDLYSMGWVADYPTMDSFLYPNFHSDSGDNYGMYNNPEINKALEEARKTSDDKERVEKYRQIEEKILDDGATIPIYFSQARRLIQSNIQGVVVTPLDEIHYELLWVKTE
ncbi:MAG: peptide ABC transporter substrate-binding protein [Actinomycetia bacterium]|nr:peptide ABC transporter substrate-binding protein [Actinomycetes bacterium]